MFTGLFCFGLGMIAGALLHRHYGDSLFGKVEADVSSVVKSVENAAETIGKVVGKE